MADETAVPATPPVQKPSLGRVVLYRVPEMAPWRGNKKGEFRAAIVVRAWPGGDGLCVNLRVFTDLGDTAVEQDTVLASSCTMGDAEGQWSWPPRV